MLHDHASHKVEPLSRPGPPPVLSSEEENDLEQWIIKMSEIGYGQCKQQAQSSPFPNNLPGKDWWYAFLKRHSQLSLRTSQALELHIAKMCTPSTLNKWYTMTLSNSWRSTVK